MQPQNLKNSKIKNKMLKQNTCKKCNMKEERLIFFLYLCFSLSKTFYSPLSLFLFSLYSFSVFICSFSLSLPAHGRWTIYKSPYFVILLDRCMGAIQHGIDPEQLAAQLEGIRDPACTSPGDSPSGSSQQEYFLTPSMSTSACSTPHSDLTTSTSSERQRHAIDKVRFDKQCQTNCANANS